ncbi:cisplatin damage response ATP-dependent DNA ligase [Alteraurantiacibacter aquimixticola]|uniref:DNA ligase (ATP) n=1 Tax=Alteraurantiacibacter aquimixticola TaxID=2489173 RepID=A0A4T3EZ69_9SPHN|nr:cisplatin damage response ATP-dependent DNA ligase [Alteraurantiacibacter aquimixticola]TIX49169.1 cisplatin damage response ATP-dependent DNA ligase [Alteraurantiacibacter aquimixticola]
MQSFAALIDALVYTSSRNAKLQLIADYLRETPDPDRGWAMAALTDGLDFPAVKSSTIRNLMKERVDPVLWSLSRDFVGDTAETASLLWPDNPQAGDAPSPSLDEAVQRLSAITRNSAMSELPRLLDPLDASGRYALIKLATGGMRVGVSARLAKTAFAQAFDVPVDEVEEYWHALTPPYAELFAWAADGADPPDTANMPLFRPFMLAHPLEETVVDLADYVAEWKWDGIRVQLAHVGGETRAYSRSGDDISATFPEMIDALDIPVVLDGELLVRGDVQGGEAGGAASFNALQQRLGRKTVSKKMLAEAPAFVRLYDVLMLDGEDLRALRWTERRAQLEALMARLPDTHFDLSQVVEADHFDHLAQIREGARDDAIEGLMLKRRDSPYVAGRKTGLWYKWKRDPLLVDCVLMYAQRGSGKRSSFYSDYTFGCWDGDPDKGAELLPVGKAYSGFTDEELKKLDRHVRQNTVNRFGPVRETDKSLVFEVAFDSVHESKRHKSGLAMRFPRISRIRWDKPVHEADRIDALRALIRD